MVSKPLTAGKNRSTEFNETAPNIKAPVVATPQAVLYEVPPLLVKLDPEGTFESEGPARLQIKELRAD